DLTEKTQKKELIYKGKFIDCFLDQVILPNGKTSTREYLHHPGAIAAVPVLDDGRIILEKQFRYPTGKVILEIPAGKLEDAENPEDCARRELTEEIGYEPQQLILLTSIWTTPGFSDEIIHLFLAKGLKPLRRPMDNDEFLEVITMSKSEVFEHIYHDSLIDSKTALALMMIELKKLW
ncbi:MAG TPA: ADP-ribose pyrophosphatase, partial [Firmicutes bacterium]|nr:ADP-ribose pyrophosphatase [Bacillota bacterium]